jgi:sugar fermentation stimulation protein A
MRYYLEVKSCTFFSSGGAFFPDAATERGRRHLLTLQRLQGGDVRCGVLFVVYCGSVRYFLPEWHTDAAFARTLLAVRGSIDVVPIAVTVNPDLTVEPSVRRLPVPWTVVESELGAGGAYAVVLRLRRARVLGCGALGRLRLRAGYYVYVGSALNGLDARLARHARRRKRHHWHIDYLRDAADWVGAYPIRTKRRIECELAAALRACADDAVEGFGCNDCRCGSHLLAFTEAPTKRRAFIDTVNAFRFRR